MEREATINGKIGKLMIVMSKYVFVKSDSGK